MSQFSEFRQYEGRISLSVHGPPPRMLCCSCGMPGYQFWLGFVIRCQHLSLQPIYALPSVEELLEGAALRSIASSSIEFAEGDHASTQGAAQRWYAT